jgi:hypothetical protein
MGITRLGLGGEDWMKDGDVYKDDGVLAFGGLGTPTLGVVDLFVCIAWRLSANSEAFGVVTTVSVVERSIA